MDPWQFDPQGWMQAGVPALAVAVVWMDLKARVKRLEEKVTEHNRFRERIEALELTDARHEGPQSARP